MNLLTKYMSEKLYEVNHREFYEDLFKSGTLQTKGVYKKGIYNGIIIEVTKEKKKNNKNKVLRHTLTSDLDKIDEVVTRENFCLMSPISYVGKKRISENARELYALAIDLDGVIIKDGEPIGLYTLFHQIEDIDRIPRPTYIVSSGTGLHLYYIFEKPIMLFKNVIRELQKYKKEITRIIWQGYITELEKNVQYESIFQGFRVVGTITKKGERARAFHMGDTVTMEYMNSFVRDEFTAKNFTYKSKMTLEKAKKEYPEWYDKRVIRKQPKNTWICKRELYDWWKNRIINEAKTGHRYYCLMCLAIYARKSGIKLEELEKDAFIFMEKFDKLPSSKNNPFTEKDVIDALQAYDDSYMTYPIASISYLTNIHIEKNKRNGRKQEVHLEEIRMLRDFRQKRNGTKWTDNNGRPKGSGTKSEIIKEWRKNNPNKTKADCNRDTKLDPKTIRKWWDTVLSDDKKIQCHK